MSLVILYGTQTGMAERIGFRIARLALKRGIPSVRCLPADEAPVERWYDMAHGENSEPYSAVLFILSNASQGDPPESFRTSWSRLLTGPVESLCLRQLRYAVFGLGDSTYPKFNHMAKMLHNWLQRCGCVPLLFRGLGDESDAKGIDEVLLPWLMSLWLALGCNVPQGEVSEDPLDAQPYPLYKVAQLSSYKTMMDSIARDGHAGVSCEGVLAHSAPPVYLHSTFTCEVTSNQRLTAADHFQNVHHIDLRPHLPLVTLEGDDSSNSVALSYEVGDALGVYCPNKPAVVEELLERLRLTGDEVLLITPDGSHGLVQQSARPFFGKPMTSRFLFTHYVDLDAAAQQDFFWMLAFFVEKRMQFDNEQVPLNKLNTGETLTQMGSRLEGNERIEDIDVVNEVRERLLELANPTYVDGYLQYAHREKRNVCEVLYDFNMTNLKTRVEPPLESILTFLTPMRPRYFSLSSAPAMDGPSKLSLTVAQLSWQTPMKRHRTGLSSTYLVELQVGAELTCLLWQGTLSIPTVPCPLLCIATGTGIAPIRSLIRQCGAMTKSGWADAPIYLFFGCRNEAKDFLYADEWRELRGPGNLPQLHVTPAFSRDTATKIYVQHQLGESAKLVNLLLLHKGAVVYVCGNSKQMPKDVQSTLEHIMATCEYGGDSSEAARKMKQLAKLGRYQVDTWSA